MQSGLSAQEERAFAAIVRDLEVTHNRVRWFHLCALVMAWAISLVALIMFVQPVVVGFACFLALAGTSAGMLWAVRQLTTETAEWHRGLTSRERFGVFWTNLRG